MATPSRARGSRRGGGRGRGRSGGATSHSSRGASNYSVGDIDDLTRQFGNLTCRKQSTFVFFFLGEKLYATRNVNNHLGTPGGRRLEEDDSIAHTMERKFRHEIGRNIPKLNCRYFDWHDPNNRDHMVRFFCKTLTRKEADALPTGHLDNYSDESEALWLPWRDQLKQNPGKLRFHVVPGLEKYEKCSTGKLHFDGSHQF